MHTLAVFAEVFGVYGLGFIAGWKWCKERQRRKGLVIQVQVDTAKIERMVQSAIREFQREIERRPVPIIQRY